MRRGAARLGEVPPRGRPRERGARRARARRGTAVRDSPRGSLIDAALRARGPYSMRLSTRLGSDATRVVRDGRLTAVVPGEEEFEVASAWQLPDGTVRVRAPSETALEEIRFALGLEDDHSEFLQLFGAAPLLGAATR